MRLDGGGFEFGKGDDGVAGALQSERVATGAAKEAEGDGACRHWYGCYSSSRSSSSSSSSSESSDSEVEAPAPAATTTTTSSISPMRTETPPSTSRPSTTTLGSATISVCQGKACKKRGADRVMSALQHSTEGVETVQLSGCKCLGQCKRGPAVRVEMPTGQKIIYVNVNGAEVAVQLAGTVLQ